VYITRDEVGIVDLFHGFMDVENLDSYNNLTGKPPSESLICVVGIIDLLQLRSSFPFWYCDFTEGAINVDGSLSGISGSLFGAKFLFYIFCLANKILNLPFTETDPNGYIVARSEWMCIGKIRIHE
jgi:hypothetical protein